MANTPHDEDPSVTALADILPPAPWQLVPGYTIRRTVFGVVLMLVAAAAAIGYLVWLSGDVQAFLAEQAVWSAPTSVEVPAEMDGEVTTRKLIFKQYELKVTYPVAPDGTLRTEPLEFDTLFSAIDDTIAPVVRFDPNEPGRFALNVAVNAKGGRWGGLLFMLFGGLLVGGAIGFVGWALYVGARRAQMVAARGVPVACRTTSIEEQVVNGVKTGAIIYRFQVPERFGGKAREVVFRRAEGTPLWTDEERELVVCLVPDDPKAFVALRHDLFPLAVPEGTADTVRERLRTRDAS